MEMHQGKNTETIVAVCTPPGRGAIGIVRISGMDLQAFQIGFLGKFSEPNRAVYGPFFDSHGSAIDHGIAIFFPAPHSFTGEDILELQAHGSPLLLDLIVDRAIELGARLARAGEFSERAFLNEKIDLAQAEAIADLINASTVQVLKSARRAMDGAFSVLINQIVNDLIALRTLIEASIDFSEEGIHFQANPKINNHLIEVEAQLLKLAATAHQGCILRDGITVVIAGKPNSGKSSLLNALAARNVAIVTTEPGTTRDVLRETIQIAGMPVHVVDTAGLRQTDNTIEREGIRRARAEIDAADRILWMLDASLEDPDDIDLEIAQKTNVITIYNKIDLLGKTPQIRKLGHNTQIFLSVKTGQGIDLLLEQLKESVSYKEEIPDVFTARRRHLDALHRARLHIEDACLHLQEVHCVELLAEDLRLAQQDLCAITGSFTTDDLLTKIFSEFCIGK